MPVRSMPSADAEIAVQAPLFAGRRSVAIIGNPNTGKTTLFNALTGLSQRVGNYPGVTVESKIGTLHLDATTQIDLIDVPGAYSLAARSPDEIIAVDILLGQQTGTRPVDAVLYIGDASNPERNFYLLSQLCELNLPVVVALNMMDLAAEKNIHIDLEKLSAALGTPVVGVCASKSQGLQELRAALADVLEQRKAPRGAMPQFGSTLCDEVRALQDDFAGHAAKLKRAVHYVEAFRVLVDRDGYAEQRIAASLGPEFKKSLEERRQRACAGSLAAEEARVRYGWVKELLNAAVQRPGRPPETRSDQIDRVLTHWAAGTLVFAALMLCVFQGIFRGARPIMDWIGGEMDALSGWLSTSMSPGPMNSLLCDGVIHGAGAVLSFLPQICILFLFLAVLEDCGYMSRAAFLMDRLLAPVGLSGKAFIPMLSSFGCAVPGILATRTIGNRNERLITMLIAPLMSCSARLPVYTIMIAAFIPETTYLHGWVTLRGLTLLGLYLMGIFIAIPIACILKRFVFRGDVPPFLIELPSYKLPDWRTVAMRVYESASAFVMRAGTLILAVSVIIWALSYFPHSKDIGLRYDQQRAALVAERTADEKAYEEHRAAIERAEAGEYLRSSYLAAMGRTVEPVFRPMGWDWRISMSVLASFPAREIIVATLGTIFNLGKETDEESAGLRTALQNATHDTDSRKLFNIPVALSIMVFFALCSQCAATLAAIKRESNSWRWPILTFVYLTALAYGGALLTFQLATAAGWGA